MNEFCPFFSLVVLAVPASRKSATLYAKEKLSSRLFSPADMISVSVPARRSVIFLRFFLNFMQLPGLWLSNGVKHQHLRDTSKDSEQLKRKTDSQFILSLFNSVLLL